MKHLEVKIEGCTLAGDTLEVSERNPHFREFFRWNSIKIKNYKYNEEQIHIGAATVGGVTTGGIYKTGGDYTVKDKYSNYYKLNYKSVTSNTVLYHEIKKIHLSDKLAKAASKSYIKKYLEGNDIIVVKEEKISNAYYSLMELGRRDAALNQLESDKASAYPTLEKCKAIVNWLSGIDSLEEYEAERQEAAEKARKEFKKSASKVFIAILVIGIAVAAGFAGKGLYTSYLYNNAANLLTENKHDEAIQTYEKLGSYKDSRKKVTESKYQKAVFLMKSKEYNQAIEIFSDIDYYKKSEEYLNKCLALKATECFENKDYSEAISLYKEADSGNKYTKEINECMYQYVLANQDAKDKTTYSYIVDLVSNNYKKKELRNIYKKLYKTTSAKITVFDSARRIKTKSRGEAISDLGYNVSFKGNQPSDTISIDVKYYTKETSSSSWKLNAFYSKVTDAEKSGSEYVYSLSYGELFLEYDYACKLVIYDNTSGEKIVEKEIKTADIKQK